MRSKFIALLSFVGGFFLLHAIVRTLLPSMGWALIALLILLGEVFIAWFLRKNRHVSKWRENNKKFGVKELSRCF